MLRLFFLLALLTGLRCHLDAQHVSLFWGDTLFTESGATFTAVLRSNNFNEIGALQFTLDWDASKLTLMGISSPNLSNYPSPTLPTVPPFSLAWANFTGTGLSLPDSAILFELLFSVSEGLTNLPDYENLAFIPHPLPTRFFKVNNQVLDSLSVITHPAEILIRNCQTRVELGPDRLICDGDSLLLSPHCTACWSIEWADGLSETNRWISTPGLQVVLATGAFYCIDSDTVLIGSSPIPELPLENESILCEGEMISIGINQSDPSYFYQWSDGVLGPNRMVDMAGIFTLNVYNTQGCTQTDSVLVRLIQIPDWTLILSADTVCMGDIVNLQFTTNADTWTWLNPVENLIEEEAEGQASLLVTEPLVLAAHLENSCFSSIIEKNIEIFSSTLQIQYDSLITFGSQVQFHATGALNYFWTGPAISSDAQSPVLIAYPLEDAEYTLTASDKNGCLYRVSRWVRVQKTHNYYAPNAFSPNDDGYNDGFTLYGDKDAFSISLLQIYDRWGGLLFETKNITPNQSHLGWRGKSKYGEIMDGGLYLFRAILIYPNDNSLEVSGEIVLTR